MEDFENKYSLITQGLGEIIGDSELREKLSTGNPLGHCDVGKVLLYCAEDCVVFGNFEKLDKKWSDIYNL